MYAMFTARKLMLTSRINSLNLKLMLIMQKQQDLSVYGANIADGKITAEEFASSPTSIFNRQMLYTQTTGGNAQVTATNQMNLYMSSNPNTQVDQNALQQSYYEQALKEAAQNENKRIAVIENEIDQERLKVETQLKAAEKELDEVEKAEDKGIERSTAKYGQG